MWSIVTHLSMQNSRRRSRCELRLPTRPQCTQKGHLAAPHWVLCVQNEPPGPHQTRHGRSCSYSFRHLRLPSTVSGDDISHTLHIRLQMCATTSGSLTRSAQHGEKLKLGRMLPTARTGERLNIHSCSSIVAKLVTVCTCRRLRRVHAVTLLLVVEEVCLDSVSCNRP